MSGWLAIILALAVGSEIDIVVVRPQSWSPSIQAWKTHREQQGFRVIEIAPEATAESTRESIRIVSQPSPERLQYILLAADAPSFINRDQTDPSNEVIPTFYVDSKVVKHFGSEPTIASDYPYADFEQDGRFRAAVGRVPANTANELQNYLARVIAYENFASYKPWRREVDIIAGVGGFGAIADAVVEGATRQLLTNDIPQEFRLSMTYASPTSVYYPAPTRFSEAAIQRMNDGGLFWVYLGHGYVDTLDYIPFENRRLPILDRSMLNMVSISAGPPIGIFLACYVGAYDARETSMAEQLLMHSNGPIAIIAGSRVTMPYGMGVLGGEMLDECFQMKTESIGKILLHAKRNAVKENKAAHESNVEAPASRRELLDSMAKALSPEGHSIVDERLEHNSLFNLLGDPVLHISHPRPLAIEIPEAVFAGSELKVRGHSPIAGKLVVELVYTRQRIPEAAIELRTAKNDMDPLDRMQAVYEAANLLTLSQTELLTKAGDFEIALPIDARCHGSYRIQASVYSSNAWSTGSNPIKVKRN